MDEIILQFASLHIFWLFTRSLEVPPLKTDVDHLQVTLKYNQAIVDEALRFYKAIIITDTIFPHRLTFLNKKDPDK